MVKKSKRKRRKIEVGRKREFAYRGLSIEELKSVRTEDLLPYLTSRERRSLKRGLTEGQEKLIQRIENEERIRTHLRDMIILPEFVGHEVAVHNGNKFIPIKIMPEMIGHYLGEFALTRKEVKHTGPGVGATKSSKYMPLK